MEKIEHETILGVRFDCLSMQQAVTKAVAWAQGTTQHTIVTPNPEMILEAQKNESFYRALAESDLSLPDGIGTVWASGYQHSPARSRPHKIFNGLIQLFHIARGKKNPHARINDRVAGVDFMQALSAALAAHKTPIFLLGAAHGVAEEVCHRLKKTYPGVHIVGTCSGSPKERDFADIKAKIERTQPAVLFVAFGAPKQELWIKKHLEELPTVKVAVGVGGSFDFIAGVKKRAPHWMQKSGLEWLYRVIQEPQRIGRIFNATVVFPIKMLSQK